MRRGVTVVVSPLLALMHDQVAALQARGVAADLLCSEQKAAARARVEALLAQPRTPLRLLYVTPGSFLLFASSIFYLLPFYVLLLNF